jgi:hypothetical protein
MAKRTRVAAVLIVGLLAACGSVDSRVDGDGVLERITPDRYVRNDLHFDAKVARVATGGTRTKLICSLLGLGAIDTVPHNFPGATRDELDAYPDRSLVPEELLTAGPNADVARVLAADMGWPFEHSDGFLYFTFDDGLFAPASARTPCPAATPNCIQTALNDDMLARADPRTWTTDSGCIALEIERAPGADEFLPITLNGRVASGGTPTGPDVVPGPGFSSGKFIFMLMPLAASTCSSDVECAAASGVPGDRCLPLPQVNGNFCRFGPCEGDAPCAVRLSPSSLVVREAGSNFVVPRIGEHVASSAVLDAYRGHFSTVSFQSRIDPATSSGSVWVLGRDSYWGTPDLPMSPYLMFHPVENGVLGEPQYFAGVNANGEPTFSVEAVNAVPLYEEVVSLPYHSSLSYFPDLDGGTWLVIYGGHAQPALRDRVSTFIQPASDSLFYDREAGIYLRWAKQPWGPWSTPATIFNPYSSPDAGYCKEMFFEDPESKTGFTCPAELLERNADLDRLSIGGMAGEYGAAIVPKSLRVGPDSTHAAFRWLMSTWNPYRVIELETELTLPLEESAPATLTGG